MSFCLHFGWLQQLSFLTALPLQFVAWWIAKLSYALILRFCLKLSSQTGQISTLLKCLSTYLQWWLSILKCSAQNTKWQYLHSIGIQSICLHSCKVQCLPSFWSSMFLIIIQTSYSAGFEVNEHNNYQNLLESIILENRTF